jgi:hypothetical protein
MFSLDNFYYIIYKNLLEPLDFKQFYFYPFGSVDPANLINYPDPELKNQVLFYDQEPIFINDFNKIIVGTVETEDFRELGINIEHLGMSPVTHILANSEHSTIKNRICKEESFLDWYYFTHGFLALDWFRDYRYIPNLENRPTKLFITFNHLVTKERSYRLNVVANLMEYNLIDQGYVSCPHNTWKKELIQPYCLLSKSSKILIYKHFNKLTKELIIDSTNVDGTYSSKFNPEVQQKGLWHLVTETVFYHDKLHLTEKIFKPIVAQRPFILFAAPGNLSYLKDYGFETFSQWIDESYDFETDNDLRIQKGIAELNKFSGFTKDDILDLQNEMRPVLEHNFNHFYTDFKQKIVTEMLFNFEKCLDQARISYKHIDFNSIKNRLLQ